MVWFKVDDSMPFHEKIVKAGNAAVGLWTRAGAWCGQQLTDGFVPDHMVQTMGTVGQAKRLLAVGLWERVPGGYQFHQWNEEGRQPTRAMVEKDRAEARERMRKAREAKRSRSPDVRANTGRTSGDVRSTRPDPTRPDQPGTHLGEGSAVPDARTDEPPLCPKHTGWRRELVPDCWACGQRRQQWEAQRGADAEFHRPAWCGDCDPHTRLIETDTGMARCPACHPLAEEAS